MVSQLMFPCVADTVPCVLSYLLSLTLLVAPAFTCSVASLCLCAGYHAPGDLGLHQGTLVHHDLVRGNSSVQMIRACTGWFSFSTLQTLKEELKLYNLSSTFLETVAHPVAEIYPLAACTCGVQHKKNPS